MTAAGRCQGLLDQQQHCRQQRQPLRIACSQLVHDKAVIDFMSVTLSRILFYRSHQEIMTNEIR